MTPRPHEDLVFESDQLGPTEEFLSTHYAPMRIGSGNRGRSPARITRVAGGNVSVDRLELGFTMSYDVEPLGNICLCDISAGTVDDHEVDGAQPAETYGPGQVFSFAPPDRPYRGRINHARYGITMLDPALLGQVAAPADDRHPVRLLDHHPVTPAAGSRLRRVIDHLDGVLGDPGAPLVIATAAQHLAAAVLHTFPNTALSEPTTTDRHDAHPETVRRAVAFIETDPAREMTLTEIAAAAHVTPRALQYAFTRHLQTTPMAYLRRVRLDAAHRDLLDADPRGDDTVTTVAARWGFAHPGRFAAAYRAAYGRAPSLTLHG
ncbi:helix-turn-helix transcriptional regulator [Actinomycetospora sp. TBRC 11914]|uniref:helix-turn-helix transcriptional regulator n=1 Tax=Actinomycetospora sp. TBRC 11914 TaxID=2729387 RepID=UPI00145EC448|nr:helix-turn-helix transcriptional regulator [Actinomycetospora sp. TBRC 11914]NMO88324.1 helix-turn-helix transcriptional regulator [Actinomycetospora sp. TBRC 11914]